MAVADKQQQRRDRVYKLGVLTSTECRKASIYIALETSAASLVHFRRKVHKTIMVMVVNLYRKKVTTRCRSVDKRAGAKLRKSIVSRARRKHGCIEAGIGWKSL